MQENRNINWPITLFIISYQVALFVALPFYFYYYSPSASMFLVTILLFGATGVSITAGYHRLYSHRTYKVNKVVEAILLFFGTLAGQGSALRWGFDHRLHHSYVDTDRDPYSINKGFWYAHILWLFEKPAPIEDKVVSDLTANKLVMFQHKHYVSLFILGNLSLSLLVGFFLGDYVGAFILAWWARLFLLHHSTWFINSLAHYWGARTYCKELSAVDNYMISLLTFGEGYHNYHHTFATDYRNGIRWYHFDPTKWLIWSLSKLGLASNLKEIHIYKVRKCIIKKDKDLLLNWIGDISYIKTEILERKIQKKAEEVLKKISEVHHLLETYEVSKKDKVQKSIRKELRREIKKMKKDFSQGWRDWLQLTRNIMELQPI